MSYVIDLFTFLNNITVSVFKTVFGFCVTCSHRSWLSIKINCTYFMQNLNDMYHRHIHLSMTFHHLCISHENLFSLIIFFSPVSQHIKDFISCSLQVTTDFWNLYVEYVHNKCLNHSKNTLSLFPSTYSCEMAVDHKKYRK